MEPSRHRRQFENIGALVDLAREMANRLIGESRYAFQRGDVEGALAMVTVAQETLDAARAVHDEWLQWQ